MASLGCDALILRRAKCSCRDCGVGIARPCLRHAVGPGAGMAVSGVPSADTRPQKHCQHSNRHQWHVFGLGGTAGA